MHDQPEVLYLNNIIDFDYYEDALQAILPPKPQLELI